MQEDTASAEGIEMGIKSSLFSGVIAAAFLGVVPLGATERAQVASHSKDVVVVTPGNLPELAQRHGIAFQLYTQSGDGRCYLYIEQHMGQRLLVLDVTDPAHIKQVNAISLSAPGPFDFVRAIRSSAILVQFRNNLGMALLDVRKPKAPALKRVSTLQTSGYTESLGDSAFLTVNERPNDALVVPRDYQIVDTSNPRKPALLFTVKQVNDKIARDETGTTFLLGAEGLTVIRRPRVEEKYRLAETYTN
jgi:hypothetical protein